MTGQEVGRVARQRLGGRFAHGLLRVAEGAHQRRRRVVVLQPTERLAHGRADGPRLVLDRAKEEGGEARDAEIAARARRDGPHLELGVVHVRRDAVGEPDLPEEAERGVGARPRRLIAGRELRDDAIEVSDPLEGERRPPADLAVGIAQRRFERRGVLDAHRLERLESADAGRVVGIGQRRDHHVHRALAFDLRHGSGRVRAHLRGRIAQRGADDGLQRPRVADGAEGLRRRHTKSVVAIVQARHEIVHGARVADLAEDARRPDARGGAGGIHEELEERRRRHRAEGRDAPRRRFARSARRRERAPRRGAESPSRRAAWRGLSPRRS